MSTRASPDRCCNLFGRYAHVPREMVSLQSITLARRIIQAEGATTGANSVDNPGLLAVASCVVRVACVFAMLVSLRCLCLRVIVLTIQIFLYLLYVQSACVASVFALLVSSHWGVFIRNVCNEH